MGGPPRNLSERHGTLPGVHHTQHGAPLLDRHNVEIDRVEKVQHNAN